MSNEAELDIIVEADAREAVRASRQAAEALLPLVKNAKELEKTLGAIFSGTIPKGMEQLQAYVDRIDTTSEQLLQRQRRRAQVAARELATGGPSAGLNRAAFQGTLAQLRNDPAVQALQYEKEQNKVLLARKKIYEEIRKVLPNSATEAQRLEAYRKALKELGGEPSGTIRVGPKTDNAQIDKVRQERQTYYARTLTELKQFDRELEVEMERSVIRQTEILERQRKAQEKRSPFGKLKQAASYIVDYGIVGAGIGAAYKTVDDLSKLEDKINAIQADSRASDAEVSKLSASILRLGTESRASTVDLAESADQLIKSGYSLTQAGEALRPISTLATASGASMKDATDVVLTVIKTFDLGIDRTGQITNAMVALSQRTRLPLEQIAQGLQSVGNIAHQSGVSVDEVLATFAQLSQAGIKNGTTMGSGLRALITALDNPPKKLLEALQKVGLTTDDINVKTHGLQGALDNLSKTEFLPALRPSAANVASALIKTRETYDSFHQSILNGNGAQQAAATRMDTLSARSGQLMKSFEALAMKGATPVFQALKILEFIGTKVLNLLGHMGPAAAVVGTALAALAAGNIIVWVGGLAKGINLASFELVGWRVAALLAATATGQFDVALVALNALLGPAGWIALGIGAVVGALSLFGMAQDQAREKTERAASQVSESTAKADEYRSHVAELDSEIARLSDRHNLLEGNTHAVSAATETAISKFGAWGLQIRSNVTDVDVLIAKLQDLRREQAAAMANSARVAIQGLQQQQVYASGRVTGNGDLRRNLRVAAFGASTFGAKDPRIAEFLARAISGGNVGQDDLTQLRSLGIGGKLYSSLLALVGGQDAIRGFDAKIQDQRQNYLGPAASLSDPRAVGLSQQMAADNRRLLERSAAAAKLTGRDRLTARSSIAKDADAMIDKYGSQVDVVAGQVGIDPDTGGAASVKATLGKGLSGFGVYSSKLPGGGLSPKQWKARAKVLRARGDLAGAKNADSQAVLADPNATEEDLQSVGGYDDARADKAGASAARKGARNEAATDKFDLQSVDRQITKALALGGQQKNLRSLLEDRAAIQRDQLQNKIQTQGLNAGQAKRERDSLEEQIADFATKTLSGDLAAAKQIMAKQADQAAGDKANLLTAQLASGTGNLQDALKQISASVAVATKAQIDAENEAFRAANPGVDPALAQAAAEKRREIVRDAIGKTIDRELKATDAYFAGQQLKIEIEAREIEASSARKRAGLEAFGNRRGQQNIGGVHEENVQQALQDLAVKEARYAVSKAQREYDLKSAKVTENQAIYNASKGSSKEGDALDNLEVAKENARKLKEDLDKAKNALTAMDGSSESFSSYSEAAAAAWASFSRDAKLAMPATERFGDGLKDALTSANQGLNTFFQSLLTGTAKGGQAFRQLGTTILSSIANKAISAAVDKLFQFGSSFFGKAPTPAGNIQGGEIRRAQGGETPNRDSVHLLAEPGEIMMRRSAVEFIGRENLLAANIAGNRRMSAVQSGSAASKRDPDTVNTWVVLPGQQPGMTAKDVVIAVTQDMLGGGQTKKLVRQIALGNA